MLRVVKKQSGVVGVSVAPVASLGASVPAAAAVGALVIDASFSFSFLWTRTLSGLCYECHWCCWC